MSLVEALGYLASALVLATFCMRDMRRLRWVAMASNLAFIAYAALADLAPVLVLHLLLLPINVLRLAVGQAPHATPDSLGLRRPLADAVSRPSRTRVDEPEALKRIHRRRST